MILLCALALAPQSFGPEVPAVDRLTVVRQVAAGDLDGDGDQDLVAVGSQGGNMTWNENLGGSFRLQEAVVEDPQSFGWFSVTTADLDSDGDDDILFSGYGAPAVGWIESLGGGRFGPPQAIAPGTVGLGVSIHAADVDSDGRLDVILGVSAGDAYWFRNQPDGTFVAAQQIFNQSQPIDSLAVGDLDSDGDPDILLTLRLLNSVRLIENVNGAFVFSNTILPQALNPNKLRLVDVDGDGRLDIAASLRTNREVGVARNLGGLAFAPFDLAYAPPSRLREQQWTDVDGDGLADLVIAEQPLERTVWLRNTGAGLEAPRPITDQRADVRSIAAADFDGDGTVDFALASGVAIEVFPNAANGPTTGRRITLRSNDEEAVAPGDLNGDGIADLVAVDLSTPDAYSVYPGIPARTGDATTFAGELQRLTLENADSVRIVDLDGDGAPDLLASGADFSAQTMHLGWARQLPSGEFDSTNVLRLDSGRSNPQFDVGDADGDGDLDILWSWLPVTGPYQAEWILQSAPGVFVPGPQLAPDRITEAFRLGDIDGDGDADVARFERNPNPRVVWDENDGLGDLGSVRLITPVTSVTTAQIELGDVNQNGRADLAVFDTANTAWYPSLAGGTFGGPEVVVSAQVIRPSGELFDVNNDGLLDFLASSENQPTRLVRNLGAGVFAAPETLDGANGGARAIAAADVDGDRDTDILKWTSGGDLRWHRNSARIGEGYCGPAVPNSTGESAFASAAGTASVAANNMTLIAEGMPPASFGHFLVSPMDGFMPAVQNSQGTLCLAGPIGRLNRSQAEMFQASANGDASVPFDVTNVPTPTGSVALLPGDTRYFQAWYRDANPTVTSNFTGGLRVTFEP